MQGQSTPLPPPELVSETVRLCFAKIVPGEPSRGFVESYHFRIFDLQQTEVGHINLRHGDTDHVRLYAGHIGFEIQKPFRGHGYALHACRALAPFVRSLCKTAVITCDPGNIASRKTIERLGAVFLEEIVVPPSDAQYVKGSRRKRRYLWTP